jgi:hypothetical protein
MTPRPHRCRCRLLCLFPGLLLSLAVFPFRAFSNGVATTRRVLSALPSVWFLGLWQRLWGRSADPFFSHMAFRAVVALQSSPRLPTLQASADHPRMKFVARSANPRSSRLSSSWWKTKNRGLARWRLLGLGRLRLGRRLGVFVTVVVANPGHGVREAAFVAAFGSHVEEVVGAEKNVQAAGVGGIGMEDFAGGVFVEDA